MTDIMKLADDYANEPIDMYASDPRKYRDMYRAALQSAIEALQGENKSLKEWQELARVDFANDDKKLKALQAENERLKRQLDAGKDVWRQDQARIAELQAKLDELQGEIEGLKKITLQKRIDAKYVAILEAERDAYQQAADKMAAEHKVERDQLQAKLDAAPKALEPLTDEQIADSILAADRAQWLADNFDSSHEHYNEALDKLRAYAKLIRDLLAAHGIGGTP